MEETIANDEVPHLGPQDGQDSQGNQENEVQVAPPDMTNQEIRAAFLTLAQSMTTQENRDVDLGLIFYKVL